MSTSRLITITRNLGPQKTEQVSFEVHLYGGSSSPQTVLCLHGMTESGIIFSEWAREAGVRIIALDRPGYGGSSDPPETGYGYKEFALEVGQILTELGVLCVDAVIGHSSGGPNALAVAHYLGCHVVRRCVLVASDIEYARAEGLSDPFGDDASTFLSSPIRPDVSAAELGFVTEREIVLLERSPYRSSIRRNLGRTLGVRHDYNVERALWAFDIDSFAEPSGRVHVVIGDCDPFLTIEHARFFQRKIHSAVDVSVEPGYGHFDIILDPASVKRLLMIAFQDKDS